MRICFLFIIQLIILSCAERPSPDEKTQTRSDKNVVAQTERPKRKTVTLIFDAGGESYFLHVQNDSITVQYHGDHLLDMSHQPPTIIPDTGKEHFYKARLTELQLDTIDRLAEGVDSIGQHDVGWTDSWQMRLILDGKVMEIDGRASLVSISPGAKPMVHYLVRLSPIPIELGGFA